MNAPAATPSRVLQMVVAILVGLSLRVAALCAGELPRDFCPGDCDGNYRVTVAELVQGVRLALGDTAADCTVFDLDESGFVSIAELVSAVNVSLHGCPPPGSTPTLTRPFGTRTLTPPPTPTGTASATATITQTPTLTPRLPVCGDGVAENVEECDDGNAQSGDGCSGTCRLEPGGDVCAGIPARPSANLDAVLLASGLSRPLYVTAPPRDVSRIFILEQRGMVRIVKWGRLLSTPFLNLTGKVTSGGERGLLGLAFHPDYARNGEFFVDYTTTIDDQLVSTVSRFRVSDDPDVADPASEEIILTQPQPYVTHNGGQLLFGPDGYLYITFGDGGVTANQQNNAQDPATWLGKILRIDVDHGSPYAIPPENPFVGPDGVLDEIWLMGLRNPWRASIDPVTGTMYIGDVGEQSIEEIDILPAGQSGRNYGWCCMEGTERFTRCFHAATTCPAQGLTAPALEYEHTDGCSVTGGYVYRGCAMPDLRGTYFYGDYCSAFVRSFVYAGGAIERQRDWSDDLVPGGGLSVGSISSFGTDARGELYVCDHVGGEVFKIVPES